MSSPVPKPRSIDQGTTPGVYEFNHYAPEPGDYPTIQANTQLEVEWAGKENTGYGIFSRLIDRIRGTGKKIEPCTGVILNTDLEKQKELGVEVIRNEFENPAGKVMGRTIIPFVSDLHHVTNPQEVVRTYAMGDKGAIGYNLIRLIEKLSPDMRNSDVDGAVRSERFNAVVEMLPEIVNANSDDLKKLEEKYLNQFDSPEIFKWAWNRAIIFRARWNDEANREQMIEDLKKISEDSKTTEVTDRTTFLEQKRWQIRNQMLKVFIPKLFETVIQEKQEGTLLFMSGGDEAHDGGQLSDHISVREIFYGMLNKAGFPRKLLGHIWGNHDEDAREPENLAELNKYYGDKIFYQEILPSEGVENGKKNLVVGLNTFMMAEGYWDKVLEKYLNERKDPGKVDGNTLTYITEMKNRFEEKQLSVISKMMEFDGGTIVIHAHNSRRLIDYLVKNKEKIKFKEGVNIKVISGHTHDDENFRFLADIGNGTIAEVYKSSGFIEVNGNDLRLPKGLVTEIDESGNVQVKSVSFTQDQKKEFEEIFGVKVK